MSADADIIAAAVVTAFTGGYGATPRMVSQDINVTRVHVLEVTALDQLVPWNHSAIVAKSIQVYVRANPELPTFDGGNRTSRKIVYPIQILIAAKPATTTPADVDPLKQVNQELRDWFYKLADKSLTGREEVIDGDPQILLDTDSDTLRQAGLFLSEFIISFAGQRRR